MSLPLYNSTGKATLNFCPYLTSYRLWSANTTAHPNNPITKGNGGVQFSTLEDVPQLIDPYFSPYTAGLMTGLIRQFGPRVNSTATLTAIGPGEFPTDCQNLKGAFYANYSTVQVNADSKDGDWSFTACQPAAISTWRATRARQDFSESLYLRIALRAPVIFSVPAGNGEWYLRVTVNTTAGHFELPNYMNGQTAGPLLHNDVSASCGDDCLWQWDKQLENQSSGSAPISKRNVSVEGIETESHGPRGPLLATTIALFGHGSYIEQRVRSASASEPTDTDDNVISLCSEIIPFLSLQKSAIPGELAYVDDELFPCLRPAEFITRNGPNPFQLMIMYYLSAFVPSRVYTTENIERTWSATAFLANAATFDYFPTLVANYPGVEVWSDFGMTTLRPQISVTGIVVCSVVLAVFLTLLLALAAYAARPTWAAKLDSFAMLRIGGALPERIPLKIGSPQNARALMDETPGWIGDNCDPDSVGVGQLGLGASHPVRLRKTFEAL